MRFLGHMESIPRDILSRIWTWLNTLSSTLLSVIKIIFTSGAATSHQHRFEPYVMKIQGVNISLLHLFLNEDRCLCILTKFLVIIQNWLHGSIIITNQYVNIRVFLSQSWNGFSEKIIVILNEVVVIFQTTELIASIGRIRAHCKQTRCATYVQVSSDKHLSRPITDDFLYSISTM